MLACITHRHCVQRAPPTLHSHPGKAPAAAVGAVSGPRSVRDRSVKQACAQVGAGAPWDNSGPRVHAQCASCFALPRQPRTRLRVQCPDAAPALHERVEPMSQVAGRLAGLGGRLGGCSSKQVGVRVSAGGPWPMGPWTTGPTPRSSPTEGELVCLRLVQAQQELASADPLAACGALGVGLAAGIVQEPSTHANSGPKAGAPPSLSRGIEHWPDSAHTPSGRPVKATHSWSSWQSRAMHWRSLQAVSAPQASSRMPPRQRELSSQRSPLGRSRSNPALPTSYTIRQPHLAARSSRGAGTPPHRAGVTARNAHSTHRSEASDAKVL